VVLVRGEIAGPAARKALELFQRHVPVEGAGQIASGTPTPGGPS
jgi:hypothetical protein